MFKRSIFIGSTIGVLGATWMVSSFITSHTSARFDAIFKRGISVVPICHDRTDFKASLNHYLSYHNPVGIIFVTGRVGVGKSTLIHSVLANRAHVADINWRGKVIKSGDELNEALKEAFAIKTYKDHIKELTGGVEIKQGIMLRMYQTFFPSLDFTESDASNLDSTMNDIEKVLRFALMKGKGNLKNRPVIFIDEIQALRGLANGKETDREVAKKFVSWLVRVSRDWHLCDVIFASHDGFAMEILELVDAAYCVPIVVPSFSRSDMAVVAQHYPFVTQSICDSINKYVAGHAEHVKKLMNVTSTSQMREELDKVRTSERKVMAEVMNKASSSCSGPWYRYYKKQNFYTDCYEKERFTKVMNLLAESDVSDDPEIPVDTILRQTNVTIQTLQILSHHRVLFYNPGNETIRARNKLFLTLYKEKNQKRAEIESLQINIYFDKQTRDDEDAATDLREEAAKRIRETEEKIRQLELTKLVSQQS